MAQRLLQLLSGPARRAIMIFLFSLPQHCPDFTVATTLLSDCEILAAAAMPWLVVLGLVPNQFDPNNPVNPTGWCCIGGFLGMSCDSNNRLLTIDFQNGTQKHLFPSILFTYSSYDICTCVGLRWEWRQFSDR